MSHPAPTSKSNRNGPRKTWIYVLVGAVPSVALIGLTVYVMSRALGDMGVGDGGKRYSEVCTSRLRLVAQAQLLYAVDHDETLPPASNWVDLTWSYAKVKKPKDPAEESESIYRCPTISSRREGGFGYAFNMDLGGQKQSAIENSVRTPMVFDSNLLDRNAAAPAGKGMADPPRHLSGQGNTVAYADGGVQTLYPGLGQPIARPEPVQDKGPTGLNPLR